MRNREHTIGWLCALIDRRNTGYMVIAFLVRSLSSRPRSRTHILRAAMHQSTMSATQLVNLNRVVIARAGAVIAVVDTRPLALILHGLDLGLVRRVFAVV